MFSDQPVLTNKSPYTHDDMAFCHLAQRLSIAVQKGNILSIRGSMQSTTFLCFVCFVCFVVVFRLFDCFLFDVCCMYIHVLVIILILLLITFILITIILFYLPT